MSQPPFFRKGKLSAHILLLFITLQVGLLLSPADVYGVQSHDGIEGLLSHQAGHLLLFSGMLILLYRVKRVPLNGPGWQEFTIFLYLIILWNILAFAGHWMREYIRTEQFVYHTGRVVGFQVASLSDAIFYLTRLDHLLLVPAVCMLLLALRKWGKNA